jgi:hypothetical protein
MVVATPCGMDFFFSVNIFAFCRRISMKKMQAAIAWQTCERKLAAEMASSVLRTFQVFLNRPAKKKSLKTHCAPRHDHGPVPRIAPGWTATPVIRGYLLQSSLMKSKFASLLCPYRSHMSVESARQQGYTT